MLEKGAQPMRRLLAVFVILLVLAATATAQGQAVQLTILHTSEHHGSLLPFDTPTAKGVGGMAARAAVIAALPRSGLQLLSARTEFPDAWARMWAATGTNKAVSRAGMKFAMSSSFAEAHPNSRYFSFL